MATIWTTNSCPLRHLWLALHQELPEKNFLFKLKLMKHCHVQIIKKEFINNCIVFINKCYIYVDQLFKQDIENQRYTTSKLATLSMCILKRWYKRLVYNLPSFPIISLLYPVAFAKYTLELFKIEIDVLGWTIENVFIFLNELNNFICLHMKIKFYWFNDEFNSKLIPVVYYQ